MCFNQAGRFNNDRRNNTDHKSFRNTESYNCNMAAYNNATQKEIKMNPFNFDTKIFALIQNSKRGLVLYPVYY